MNTLIIRKAQPHDSHALSTLIRRTLRTVNARDYPPHTIAHLVEIYSPRRIRRDILSNTVYLERIRF